jgi:pectate lyase
LASSDVTTPLTDWQKNSTNLFDSSGNFIVTNPIAAGAAHRFYRLGPTPLDSATADFSLKGFATLNGGTTGGEGGATVTVTNRTAFRDAVNLAGPRIVQIDGAIDIGISIFRDKTNKTIIGLGTNAMLYGNLQFQNCTNMVIRNLNLLYPAGDAMTVQDFSEQIWIDHCSFGESGDGQLDITHGCNLITVSWCTFSYTNAANTHRFSSLVGHDDSNGAEDEGRFQITYHHNWWGSLCRERMPRVRYGTVHVFNNYYSAAGNNYCKLSAIDAELFIENNFYQDIDEPWRKETTGKINALGNLFQNVTGTNVPASDPVFTPPYPYVARPAINVPMVVTNHAGVGNGPFKPL